MKKSFTPVILTLLLVFVAVGAAFADQAERKVLGIPLVVSVTREPEPLYPYSLEDVARGWSDPQTLGGDEFVRSHASFSITRYQSPTEAVWVHILPESFLTRPCSEWPGDGSCPTSGCMAVDPEVAKIKVLSVELAVGEEESFEAFPSEDTILVTAVSGGERFKIKITILPNPS